MSAIVGFLDLTGETLPSTILQAAMAAVAEYGGDGSGTWIAGSIALGHQMLRITPENETLPAMYNNRVITADARIDNREDLFSALAIPHAERPGIPDSLLILRAYEKWGTECPRYLIGDFAFAIWDGEKLFCARD